MVTDETPAAGRRVRETTPGWEETFVHHTLYLPRNWKPDASYPVLFEFGGNGGFRDAFGDTCTGTVEGCNLGYGLSGGVNYIWVCLPFVRSIAGSESNTPTWWGDPSETERYCIATVRHVCRVYGGDPRRLVLCGFSRGSIACNFIGLRDETIAHLWMAFLCHSGYDGFGPWKYPGADREAALERLSRLDHRPQFISSENAVSRMRLYLDQSGVRAPFTFETLPFRNHTDTWALRDCTLRRSARKWLCDLGLPGD